MTREISEVARELGNEHAFVVRTEIERLKELGYRIWDFSIGQPDFETPENIKLAAVRAICDGMTGYTPSEGMLVCREIVADHISRTRGVDVTPDDVVILPGGKPAISYSVFSCANPEDVVIYPNPGYPIYESAIRLGKAVPVAIEVKESNGFRLDTDYLRSMVAEYKPKLLIINSPGNPTGGVLMGGDLEEIAEIANEYDLWVLSDEIYEDFVYTSGGFKSVFSLDKMPERTIILSGFSKSYAMTGWRIGYAVSLDERITTAFTKLTANISSCLPGFTQMAAVEAISGRRERPYVEEMVQEFRKRRDVMVDLLNDIPGIRCRKPEGAFYTFPNVTELCREASKFDDAVGLQRFLLYDENRYYGKGQGVAVLAREYFGPRDKERKREEYIRLSYATSMEDIQEGLAWMKEALKEA